MAGLCYAGSSREGRTPGVRCELVQALDDLDDLGHSLRAVAYARAVACEPHTLSNLSLTPEE